MKNLTRLILALMMLVAPLAFGATINNADKAVAEPRPYTAKTPKLNRAQFDALLAKPEQLLIIDVRRPDEVSAMQEAHSKREVTTSPLQSLTLFNSEIVFGWSQALAGRVINEAGNDEAAQLDKLSLRDRKSSSPQKR